MAQEIADPVTLLPRDVHMCDAARGRWLPQDGAAPTSPNANETVRAGEWKGTRAVTADEDARRDAAVAADACTRGDAAADMVVHLGWLFRMNGTSHSVYRHTSLQGICDRALRSDGIRSDAQHAAAENDSAQTDALKGPAKIVRRWWATERRMGWHPRETIRRGPSRIKSRTAGVEPLDEEGGIILAHQNDFAGLDPPSLDTPPRRQPRSSKGDANRSATD
ncbi:hypothetical protein B0H14DRAFT_3888208 [Mycena olivaceomarginata]|nr:hypothetical protein B0H14DRAFT_3888208 [Mycena olivaceomarginata]